MNNTDVYITIAIMVVIAIVIGFWYGLTYETTQETTVIEDEEQIKKILQEYGNNSDLKIFPVRNLSKEYLEITKFVTYKIKPMHHEYKKKIYESEAIVYYYTNKL